MAWPICLNAASQKAVVQQLHIVIGYRRVLAFDFQNGDWARFDQIGGRANSIGQFPINAPDADIVVSADAAEERKQFLSLLHLAGLLDGVCVSGFVPEFDTHERLAKVGATCANTIPRNRGKRESILS